MLIADWHTGAKCSTNCKGYEKGKCPICCCTCSLYMTEDMYRKISILAITSKDIAVEMDLEEDVRTTLQSLLALVNAALGFC